MGYGWYSTRTHHAYTWCGRGSCYSNKLRYPREMLTHTNSELMCSNTTVNNIHLPVVLLLNLLSVSGQCNYEPLQRHGYTWKWRLTHRPFWAPFCDSSRSSFFLPFCCSSSTLPLGWPLSAIWPLPGLHPLLWRCRAQEYQEVGLTVSVKIEENAVRLSEELVLLSGHLWLHTRMT